MTTAPTTGASQTPRWKDCVSQTTPTPTEESQLMIWKHQCLVRWLIKFRLRDRQGAHLWLKGDGIKKGFMQLHPESTLERDVKYQWSKGNRGKEGEWYD